MKNNIKILFILLCSIIIFAPQLVQAQAPSNFNYQGVARDAQNQILKNQTISLQLSILMGSFSGTIVFSEEHLVQTTDLGVFSLQIGEGSNNSGTISGINWANGNFWLQVALDDTGGNNFTIVGTSQLVSVPYALHAQTVTEKDDADADPNNEIQTIGFNVNDNILTLTNGGQVDLSTLDNDGGGTNSGTDDQHLSLNGTTLSIEDGNSVDLSVIQDGVNDADADATNEFQTIIKNGNTVTLSNNGGSFSDDINDADADPINEIQNLSMQNNIVSLSQSNSQIDLSNFASPWVRTPQSDLITYKATAPIVVIEDSIGGKIEFAWNALNFRDTSENTTILTDHLLSFNTEYEISPDIIGISRITDLNKDSLTFDYMVDGGLLSGFASYGRDHLNMNFQAGSLLNTACLSPTNLCLTNKSGSDPSTSMILDYENLVFSKDLIGNYARTQVGLDSIHMVSQIGLLLPVATTLKPWELSFEDLDFQSHFHRTGFDVQQAISSVDVFDRITMAPDNFTMYNSTKWKTFSVETNFDNSHGQLSLYGNGNMPHTYIGSSSDGPVMELNNGQNLRIGFWGFENFGLINTQGKNGFQNTYIGPASLHNNPDFGGIGVMDNLGLTKAGIEVDELGKGVIYTTGCLKVIDDNQAEISCSNNEGYNLYGDNGESIVNIGKSVFSGSAGRLYTKGNTNEFTFYVGPNLNFNGDLTTGFSGVFDGMGETRAGMFVDVNNKGFLYSDALSIGSGPNPNSTYALDVIQQPLYGFNLSRIDLSSHWEMYITSDKRLNLYHNDNYLGGFDPITGAYTSISDIRQKKNIQGLNSVLSKIEKLNPSRYIYRNNNPNQKESIGFIAQDVATVFPTLVHESTDEKNHGTLTLDYAGFGVLAIKAIQEQQEIIDNQEQKINALESRLDKIEALLSKQ